MTDFPKAFGTNMDSPLKLYVNATVTPPITFSCLLVRSGRLQRVVLKYHEDVIWRSRKLGRRKAKKMFARAVHRWTGIRLGTSPSVDGPTSR